MSNMTGLGDHVAQINEASRNLEAGDARNAKRLDGIEARVNELFKRTGRPGAEWSSDLTDERKSAVEMCKSHHAQPLSRL